MGSCRKVKNKYYIMLKLPFYFILHLMLRRTLVVIVCAVVVGLVGLVVLIRAVSSCSARRRARPLPPVQPLAHYRQQQLARYEATSSQLLSTRGSKSSLLGSYIGECANTVPEAESLLRPPPIAHSSFVRQSKSLPGPRPDDQSQPHHHRPLSVASSQSRLNSRRGLPHGLYGQGQVIMPAPLAPGVAPTSSSQSFSELNSMSVIDRWVFAGKDNAPFCTSTTSVGTCQIDQTQASML